MAGNEKELNFGLKVDNNNNNNNKASDSILQF